MEHTNEAAKKNHEPQTNEPLNVVLADDDKDDQEIFQDALSETNIPVALATVDSGQELIDHLKDPNEPNPDIIFLDINMPVKNGKEVLAEIKSDETLNEIPIVMLSTSGHVKDVEDTFTAGANLYVQKPGSFRGLINLLKKIFTLNWAGVLINPVRKTFLMSEKNVAHED